MISNGNAFPMSPVMPIDFGLSGAVMRTEQELLSGTSAKRRSFSPDDAMQNSEGVHLVPHPIDLLFFMELKKQEEEDASRIDKAKSKSKPIQMHARNALANQSRSEHKQEQQPDRIPPSNTALTQKALRESNLQWKQRKPEIDDDEDLISELSLDWKDVYKQALDPFMKELPALKINPETFKRSNPAYRTKSPPLPQLSFKTKETRSQSFDGKRASDIAVSKSCSALNSISSLGSLDSVLSLCSDAPPAEFYQKAEVVLLSPADLLRPLVLSPDFQQACKKNGVDLADLKRRCRNYKMGVIAMPDPIALEGLAYVLWSLHASETSVSRTNEHLLKKEMDYLHRKFDETQNAAEQESISSTSKMSRAWTAIERSNRNIENRRVEINSRAQQRKERLEQIEMMKQQKKIEAEEKFMEQQRIFKERSDRKRENDELHILQLEKRVEEDSKRKDQQVEAANRRRLERTYRHAKLRNEKIEKAKAFVQASEQMRRQNIQDKLAEKDAGHESLLEQLNQERAEEISLKQAKTTQLHWHAERRRRALKHEKVERFNDVKDKHKFLEYDNQLHDALLRERNARQKSEILEKHIQQSIREKMVMSISPGPGEYGEHSIDKPKPAAKGGVFPREAAPSFLKETMPEDAILTPGPGQYFRLESHMPAGGQFSTAHPKTALEWEIYRASKIPGPADYRVPGKFIHGGKFSPDEISKRTIDRIMDKASQIPGPADYAPDTSVSHLGDSMSDIASKLGKSAKKM